VRRVSCRDVNGARLGAWTLEAANQERWIDMRLSKQDGIIKYGIAWLLGVPLSLLIIIFILMRGC
jgi:hypothetical protein